MNDIEENRESILKLRNHMEDVVTDMLEKMLPRFDVCKCEVCRKDMIAWALNHLPPKYSVTQQGDLYHRIAEFTPQFEIDVQVALTEAINTISKNPRHKN